MIDPENTMAWVSIIYITSISEFDAINCTLRFSDIDMMDSFVEVKLKALKGVCLSQIC